MRINAFHNILELVKQEVLHQEAEYRKRLKVAGNNPRYDFRRRFRGLRHLYKKTDYIFDIKEAVSNGELVLEWINEVVEKISV